MNRRAFLKGTAAVTVVAAGGSAWRVHDQGVLRAGSGPAYEPWANWPGEMDEPELVMVRAAILAANPHNTQPWLFRISDRRIELHADEQRNLGAFDPFRREMHLGLGCALENMSLTARALGYEPAIMLRPGTLRVPPAGGFGLAAVVELADGEPGETPLYSAIPDRHTNRGPYVRSRSIPLTLLDSLRPSESESDLHVIVIASEPARSEFGRIVIGATDDIIADGPMVRESDRWYRHGWSEIQAHRDGPTLDAAGLSRLTTFVAKVLPRPSADQSHEHWRDATADVHVATAPAFGLISVRDLYDRPTTLRAGRLWQRLHLLATTRGLAMQPLNQPVEVVDREQDLGAPPRMARQLQRFTQGTQWRPTFAFRVGYPEREVGPSPRRPVEQVLRG